MSTLKAALITAAMTTAGVAMADLSDLKFGFGADYLQAWMKGRNHNGENFSNIFPKSYPGATVYADVKLMDNAGLEAGYDWSATKKKSWTDSDGDQFTYKISRRGFHLDLVGFIPLNDCFETFASVGWGQVKPKVRTELNSGGLQSNIPVSAKSKSILRLGLGTNYMMTEMFGLRAKLGWEGTKALRLKEADGTTYKAFKDSITLALGIFARF